MPRIQGGNVLITGGTSGIGLELAKSMLAQGCRVAVLGYEAAKAEKAAVILGEISKNFKCYTVNLAYKSEIHSFVTAFLKEFSGLDILVNNAGYATYETFEESSFGEIENLIAVNFMGHVLLTKLLLPTLIAQRSGKIVNIASIAGRVVITPNAVYGACKHAILAWSKALLYELSIFNISVKVFCPGRVDTDFFLHPTFLKRELRPEMKSAMTAAHAAQQILNGMEYSNGFLFYVPRKFRFVAWCYYAIPFLQAVFFKRMMISRINLLYKASDERS